jgi:MarR family transcriptional regulator, organic hydroperoxide resistance regulator
MKSYIIPDEYYRLWLLLAQTKAALFKAREKNSGKRIYSNENSALVIIAYLKGKATQTFLAHHLSVELSSASELVTRLEKKGLVTKTPDAKRKNIMRISVTEKGNKISHEVIQIGFVRKMMSKLSKEQRIQLKTCLSILLNAALLEMGKEDELHL